MTQAIVIQRIEGLAAFVVSILLYAGTDASWWLFALLLLVPDLSMVGYLADNRAGQAVYNAAHTYAIPLVLTGVGYWFGFALLLSLSLIWLAHIGMDRALGYGLKEIAGFKYTHLGQLGNARPV